MVPGGLSDHSAPARRNESEVESSQSKEHCNKVSRSLLSNLQTNHYLPLSLSLSLSLSTHPCHFNILSIRQQASGVLQGIRSRTAKSFICVCVDLIRFDVGEDLFAFDPGLSQFQYDLTNKRQEKGNPVNIK